MVLIIATTIYTKERGKAMYVDSYEIESSAKSLKHSIEDLDHLLVLFQTDLDTNEHMREYLDWDYMDIRKTLDVLLKQTNNLVKDAENAVKNEEDEEEEDEE